MIAKNNEFMQEATETLFELNADDLIRQQCLARQDYYRGQAAYQKRFAEQEIQIQALTTENKALTTENEALSTKNDALSTKNDALSTENEILIAEKVAWAVEKSALSAANDALIAEKDDLLSQVNAKEQLIKNLQAKLEAHNN